MKVLYLAKDLNPRQGWGRYSVELIEGLRELGVEALTCTPAGPSQGELPLLGPTRWKLQDIFQARADAQKLASLRLGVGAIHALDETTAQTGSKLAAILGLPFVLTLHGTYAVAPLRGLKGLLLRRAFRSADLVLANSDYTLKQSEEAMGARYTNAQVVALGVGQELIDPVPRPLAARSRTILSVGSVKPRKGMLVNVLAFADLLRWVPDAKLVIAGSISETDSYVIRLRNEISKRGLEGKVRLLGEVTEDVLEELYRSSRVFCMPALREYDHFEGFGLVHLEASAKGLPTIGSREGGNLGAIQDGCTGFVVDPRNRADIAQAMHRTLTDDDLWSRMSSAGVAWAKRMNWRDTAERTFDAYSKLGVGILPHRR